MYFITWYYSILLLNGMLIYFLRKLQFSIQNPHKCYLNCARNCNHCFKYFSDHIYLITIDHFNFLVFLEVLTIFKNYINLFLPSTEFVQINLHHRLFTELILHYNCYIKLLH